MLKNITHKIISLVFVLSILGPSIIQLYNTDSTEIVIADIVEEELKEKILPISLYLCELEEYSQKSDINSYYIEVFYTHVSEIIIPPPEHIG